MFLTRLGFGSKAVITGDAHAGRPADAARRRAWPRRAQILKDIEGIRFCEFTERDVVRHPLVQEVVRAYDAAQARREAEQAAKKAQPG